MISSNIIYGNYLTRFSLSFKKKNDWFCFDRETKFQIMSFIKFFYFVIILVEVYNLSLMTKIDIFALIKIFVILLTLILGLIIYILIKKNLSLRKAILELFLGFLILSYSLIQLEMVTPDFLKVILLHFENELGKETLCWLFFSLGIAFEMIIMIAVINLRWMISSCIRYILYLCVFGKFFHKLPINAYFGCIESLLALIYIIIPISVSYLNEKSYKELYVSLKRNQENLICFEKLIEKNIPSQIIILKYNEASILYANSKAKEFFKTNNDEFDILLHRLGDINLNNLDEENRNDDNNLISAYKKLTNEKSCMNFTDIEDYEFKNYDGIYKKSGNIEEECNYEKCVVNLDIKIGVIQWKSENAVLILLNDISSKRKIQNLKEINEYKDLLLASVSHDLRTPLGSIIGFLEILMEKITDKKQFKYLSAAYKSSKILLFMINDILDFSQISNKKIKLNNEEIYIKELLDGILDVVKYQWKKKGLKFKTEFPDAIENIKIECDPIRLQQILLNLLGNAIKFTFQGQIILKVTIDDCEFHNNSHKKIVFLIIDTGIGIELENISKIFELFYKVDSTKLGINKNGIGLGLFISQNLCKLMHDEGIKVHSQLNKGSEFSFSLPFNKDSDETLRYWKKKLP